MLINTIFGPMEDSMLVESITTVSEDENQLVEHFEYHLKDLFAHEGVEHPAGTKVHEFIQMKAKRVNTIFGFYMDVSALDKRIEVTENENEFTQCPEYRLKEPFIHEGVEYKKGHLVHRSAHVYLKVGAEAASNVQGF